MKRLLNIMSLTAISLFALGLLIPLGAAAQPPLEEWVAIYNGPGNGTDRANDIEFDPLTGHIYVTGDSYGNGTSNDYATLAYDIDGNELWVAIYNGPGNRVDYPYALAVNPTTGDVYVTGQSRGSDITDIDFATVAYDADGNELWVKRYTSPTDQFDIAYDIAVDSSIGNIYVTGFVNGGSGLFGELTTRDYATVAYDSDGNELWARGYNGPVNDRDEAYAIAIDAFTGNVYVTGSSESATYSDYATVAYDSDGNELWVKRYNGPGNSGDGAADIAVDPSMGNIYVTGESGGSGTGRDYATLAYDSDGNELWVQRYNGPGNGLDQANAIAVDPSTGNVYVTGYSIITNQHNDYATVAYDSDGNELWVQIYGPSDNISRAYDIAIDPSTGDVYVTGTSDDGIGIGSDYATVAYDPDGNELWVKRYQGPGNSNDQGVAITVDPSTGNIYVTGWSHGIDSGTDFGTIKYNVDPGATPEGDDIVVNPVDPDPEVGDGSEVTVTFEEVTSGGETTVTSSGTGTPPPEGFKLGNPPVYYSIETTADYTPPIQICIDYSDIEFGNENKLRLWHRVDTDGDGIGDKWEDSTDPGYPDTSDNILCGTVESLSEFAMLEAAYQFVGFLPPLESPPVINATRAGGAIPIKFRLMHDDGYYISDLGAVTGIWYQTTPCGSTSENGVYDTDSTGSSGLRYDMDTNQFIYTWKTKKSMAGCYSLTLEIYGFDQYVVYFELK